MSTNKSQNLNLHLWEPEDNFLRAEFNENFTALDAAMKAEQTTRAAADAAEAQARAAAVSAEAQARAQAIQQLQNSINSTGGSASSALEQTKQELSNSIAQAQTTANAAWSASNPPCVFGTITFNRGTENTVTLGFQPSFVLMFGSVMSGAIRPNYSTNPGVYCHGWPSDGFSFGMFTGTSSSAWGDSGFYLAWK